MRYAFLALPIFICMCADAQTGNATVSGRVAGYNGEALTAQVNVYQSQVVDGRQYLQQRCSVTSDADGQFTCPRLPAGKFLIRAIPRFLQGQKAKEGTSAAAPSFYPGVSDLSEADTISVLSGGSGWAEIRQPESTKVSVRGTVIPRAPEVAFTLKAESDGTAVDTGVRIHYAAETGLFDFQGITPGHYLLEADWLVNDFEHRAYVPFDVGESPIDNLEVTPLSSMRINGRIENVLNTEVTAISLRRADGAVPVLNAIVKNNLFQFNDVPAGKYYVELESNHDQYVFSLSVDGKDYDGSFFAADGESEHTLDVKLQEPAFSIHGSVKPWDEDAGASDVVAIAEQTGAVFHTLTDRERRFSIVGLPPGPYRLFAWPGPDIVPYRSAAIRKKYQRDSVEVSLKPGNVGDEVELTPIQ